MLLHEDGNAEEALMMTCHVCGSSMRAVTTDLPFKIADHSIVIVKDLPVLQCDSCREYLIEDAVLARLDELLQSKDESVELEIIRYAA